MLAYPTLGLFPLSSDFGSIVTGGSPARIPITSKVNDSEDPTKANINDPRLNLSSQQLSDLQALVRIKDPSGSIVVPSPTGFLQLGNGYTLDFDPDTLQGRITPASANVILTEESTILGGATESYTGSDIRLLIESSEPSADGRRYAKQLIEATTITISIHREIVPVRASGFINPKGFALGTRTIAGSLIVTQFTAEILLRFLQSVMMNDGSKDTFFSKVDQLPPFNITMICTNESGYASSRRLLGVKFVTDGVVYSSHDMLSEQTISWMASDFTPLVPLTLTHMYLPLDPTNPTTRREKTPTNTMRT